MARIINTIELDNKWAQQQPDRIKRVWTFRTQEQMDLWINEMQGQISDGMWENCRNTNWLWEGTEIYQLGEKTELHIKHYWMKGKTGYPLTRELLDCIGDRMIEENGFETEKELKAAWREIQEAIKDPKSFTDSDYIQIDGFKALRNVEEAKAKEAATGMLEDATKMLEEMYEEVEEPSLKSNQTWTRHLTSKIREERVTLDYIYSAKKFKVQYRVGCLPEIELTLKDVKELKNVLEEMRECLGRVHRLKMKMR